MSKFEVVRTGMELPPEEKLAVVRDFLFGVVDGFDVADKRAWRRVVRMLVEAEPGEVMQLDISFPRSGRHHKFWMAFEKRLFDSQERFANKEMLHTWLKIGAGYVDWVEGKTGLIPLPKELDFANCDEHQFYEYREAMTKFLRGGYAAKFLWPHLSEKEQYAMIDSVLDEFRA